MYSSLCGRRGGGQNWIGVDTTHSTQVSEDFFDSDLKNYMPTYLINAKKQKNTFSQ